MQREPSGSGEAAAAGEHAARVRDHLLGEIAAAGGFLSFERFMDLALYAPYLGYYASGAQKLGLGGDFTTAPEVSRLFGCCVAAQCAEILDTLESGCILEIGAGSGRLAVDILTRLEKGQSLPRRYCILEVSADLKERQCRTIRQQVPHLAALVSWLDAPPDEPFDGVILANEVLDALPVARFRWHADGVEELGVVARRAEVPGEVPMARKREREGQGDGEGRESQGRWEGQGQGHREAERERASEWEFEWAARPADAAMTAECNRLGLAAGGWDDGYISEYCPRMVAFTGAVTQALRRGVVLWFDYGLPRAQYYLPERHEGTLISHFRHRAHGNPLRNAGLQDISAWVDFTRVAEASRAAGFELAGFTTQAHFLAGTGIDREMQRLAGTDPFHSARLSGEARQLLLPGEMGERFKAMAWTRELDLPLSGFGVLDLRHTL